MRIILLASAAAFAAKVTAAGAQTLPPGAPTQGQAAWPLPAPMLAISNDNNNSQAAARSGPVANPTPGTIEVHINGRVNAGFGSFWSNADTRSATAPATGSLGAILGNNGAGTVKLAPDTLYSYARIYFGADAMATNGLRYGAAMEIRQNFTGQISNSGSSGASGYSSLETLFVRRAFTYVAGDKWGIVRVGQADGVIGLFDNGVTTLQYLPTGNLQNGSDLASLAPTNAQVPFFFLSLDGNEYAYAKAVYLSPQIAGFDFGMQYAPNTSNGFGLGGSNNAFSGLHYWRGHRNRQPLRGGEFRLSFLVVWPWDSGWRARHQSDDVCPTLSGDCWWRGGLCLCGLRAQRSCELYGCHYVRHPGDDGGSRQQIHRPV